MKKQILIFVLAVNSFAMFSQQWTGSATNTGTITHNGPVMMDFGSQVGTGITKIYFGPAWGSVMNYGTGAIGFNFIRNGNNWDYETDGSNNGAALIFSNVGGDILFSNKSSLNGTLGGSITSAQILSNIKMKIASDGRIGINTTSPSQQLDVVGNIKSTGFILPTGAGANKVLTSDINGNATWQTLTGGGGYWSLSSNNLLNTNTGGVIIGTGITSVPAGYKLYVSSGILTEKIKVAVKNTADWSDHVFSSTYKLKPLLEVAKFIEQNKHLPDIPSATEVVNNGIDLAKMDATLLQKIEELTLYMIELKKENDVLKSMIVQDTNQHITSVKKKKKLK